MVHEYWNIFASISQWWNANRKHIQPKEKILTKALRTYLFSKIKIGCGNYTDVHLLSMAPANALNFTLL